MTTHFDRRASRPRLGFALLLLLLASTEAAYGQLRIVSYNTSTGHNSGTGTGIKTARPDMDIVLEAIGEESINGIARPIDVLLLQEQFSMSVSTQSFVNVLNTIYGTPENPTPYARGVINGQTSEANQDAGRPGIVYNTNTVQLVAGVNPGEVSEVAFGTVNGSNQARSTLRYRIRPVGYDDSAIFYAYNDHYKAGSSSTDQTRRNIEATNIRTHATYGSNTLGEGAHAIFVGDYNMQSSNETAFQTMITAGVNVAGKATDPINRLGTWNNAVAFADIHTQAPCDTGSPCASDMVAGGMDDRFDIQLVTDEFLDGEGLSYITGSYRAFGNNGTTFEDDINATSNTYPFSGVATYTQDEILDAIWNVSDHIPVVADYQLPAILEAIAGAVPATFNVDEIFDLNLSVGNDAPVLTANGADELDYTITFSGDIFDELPGPINGSDPAAGGIDTHFFTLNTATPGVKSGTLTISSLSQAVQNGLVNIPISFEVLAPPADLDGDYNDDGVVDAADYVVWRKFVGETSSLPNDPDVGTQIDDDQYNTWVANFGDSVPGAGGSGQVPEPAAWMLLTLSISLLAMRRSTLTAWTRQP